MIPIARLLDARFDIGWEEAVAVALVAGRQSLRRGVNITAENCLLLTSGGVELLDNGAERRGPVLSDVQLLALLAGRGPLPPDLSTLVARADDPLSGFPSEDGAPPAPGAVKGLDAFASDDDTRRIARLVERALAAGVPYGAPMPHVRRRLRPRPPSSSRVVAAAGRPASVRRRKHALMAAVGATVMAALVFWFT